MSETMARTRFGRISKVAMILPMSIALALYADDARLIGNWPLKSDATDHSGMKKSAKNRGVQFSGEAGQFDGKQSLLEVPPSSDLQLGSGDFTAAMWINSNAASDDQPGDLLSCYDPATRRGFHLSLKTHDVTTSRANFRTLHFGLDQNRIEQNWRDHGRPGEAVLIFGLCVHRGQLFAATCESNGVGHVYRWSEDRWIDCKIPAVANSVSAMASHDGQLYAATSKYRLAGSALTESTNTNLGGKIFRLESDGRWTDCGTLPNTEAVGGLTVFGGKLVATSLYRPAGFFRYEGGQQWTALKVPGGKRVEAMCVHNGQLFASSYDEAHIYRFDGESWTDCGQVGDETNTQTYSFAIHHGQMYVGTWRSGKVYRYDGDHQWADCGRLGEELEVMGMLVHNGRLWAGSLPLAGVYQFEDNTRWSLLNRVDLTPDVMYRRAWTMAEFGGRAFVGTLPSGHVLSNAAGINVTWDEQFPSGWHHVVARRSDKRLSLFVDGRKVSESVEFNPQLFDISVNEPLKIGFGPTDYFLGSMRDVRLYRGALSDEEIGSLANSLTP